MGRRSMLKSLAIVKFGGSLIDFKGTNIPLITKRILDYKELKGLGPVAVFSAPKGVTDRLIAVGEAKAMGRNYDLDELFQSYLDLAYKHVDKSFIGEFQDELTAFRHEVEETLIKVERRFVGSTKARLLTSGGELPTASLMKYILKSQSAESFSPVKSEWPIVTDDNFDNATPDFELSRKRISKLCRLIDEGMVISIGGFLGVTHDGLETLLGRGGSDQTAVFLSCLLREYYDVETILVKETPVQSADPATVKGQGLERIPVMTYNEASKATVSGMTIIQNAAVRLAMQHRLPVTVAPLKDPYLKTLIQAEDPGGRIVKCVTGLRGCAIVTMRSESSRSLEDCLRLWEGYDNFIDLGTEVVETGEVIRDFLIYDAEFVKKHEEQLKSFDRTMHIEYGVGLVTLIGDRMKDSPGVASIAIGAIPNINIKRGIFAPHTSQIILVVNDEDVPEAVARIHSQLYKINEDRRS
ncbi:MAG: amino acid kinase family protein [Candidatus Bathyarchaeia archaeon]